MDAFEATVGRPLAEAEGEVRQALAAAGFGVLTEIDVAAVLRAKLGVHRPPLKILGACNPAFARRALELDATVALVLPCNVVLEDLGGGRTRVAVADPRALLAAGGAPVPAELAALGEGAAAALAEAVGRLRR